MISFQLRGNREEGDGEDYAVAFGTLLGYSAEIGRAPTWHVGLIEPPPCDALTTTDEANSALGQVRMRDSRSTCANASVIWKLAVVIGALACEQTDFRHVRVKRTCYAASFHVAEPHFRANRRNVTTTAAHRNSAE